MCANVVIKRQQVVSVINPDHQRFVTQPMKACCCCKSQQNGNVASELPHNTSVSLHSCLSPQTFKFFLSPPPLCFIPLILGKGHQFSFPCVALSYKKRYGQWKKLFVTRGDKALWTPPHPRIALALVLPRNLNRLPVSMFSKLKISTLCMLVGTLEQYV